MNSNDYNKSVGHPLQSFEWGKFREKTGVKVVREKDWQMMIHKVPYAPWTIGYFPKGPMPDRKIIEKLKLIGKKENCIFIQLEPNIVKMQNEKRKTKNLTLSSQLLTLNLVPSARPLFTRYTFVLDLTKSEEELLRAMHPKTRYNIRVAQKHNVKVIEDNSDKAFGEYLRLTQETTKRQGFYAHTEKYHRLMWQTLKNQNLDKDKLTAHLLVAKYKPNNEQRTMSKGLTLAAWILFVFKDTLYYPYGASSNLYKETMASNLMMWEAIKFGKKMGLKKFDMWGALGPNPDPKDPWYGFNRFKHGYAGELVEFIGSYDLVINPILYNLYKLADNLRWLLLKFNL